MTTEETIPSHDEEAEARVLSTMLYWPETRAYTDPLQEHDFYLPRHRLVLSLLRQQQDRSKFCDELVLYRQLQDSMPEDDAFHLANRLGDKIASNLEPWNIEPLVLHLRDMRMRRERAIAGAKLLRGEEVADLSMFNQQEPTTTVAKIEAEINAEIDGTRKALEFTHWPVFSSTQCLLPGKLTLICGSPGVSKSLLVIEAIWRWILDGIPVAILALESGQEFHIRRAIAQKANCANFMRAKWNRENALAAQQLWAEERDFAEMLKPYVFSPQGLTPKDLLAWLSRMGSEGKRVCIIDPVSMMEDGEKVWIAHNKFIHGAKKIIERYGLSLICVTHPNDGSQGETVRPLLSNLPGSKAWRRFVDSVFWLHCCKQGPVNINTPMGTIAHEVNRVMYCLKVRLDENPGRIGFFFDPQALTHKECGKLA